MRIYHNQNQFTYVNISGGLLTHELKDYRYESDYISKFPSDSVIEFFAIVGGAGEHDLYVYEFKMNVLYRKETKKEEKLRSSLKNSIYSIHLSKFFKLKEDNDKLLAKGV